jgi:hypothetical protein
MTGICCIGKSSQGQPHRERRAHKIIITGTFNKRGAQAESKIIRAIGNSLYRYIPLSIYRRKKCFGSYLDYID